MSITRISPTTYRVSGSPNTLNQPWTTVVGAPGADAITLAVKPLTAQGLMDFRAATSSVVTLDVSGSWNLKVVAPATAATTLTGTLAKNISLLVDGSNTFKTDGSIDNLTVGSGVRNIIYSSALENSSLRMANPNDTLATFSTSNWLTFKDSSTGSITMYDASHASNTVTLGSVSNPYGGVINIAVDGGSSTNVSNVLDGLSITQGVGDSGHKFQTNQYMDSVYSYGDYSSYLQYGNLNNSNLDLFSQARFSNYLYTSLNSWDNNYFSKNIVLSGDGNIQIDYSYGSIDGNLRGPHGTIVLNMYSNDVGLHNNQSMVGLNSNDVINITSGATVHLDYFNGGGSIGPVSVYLVGGTGETIYATSTQYNAFTAVVGSGPSDTVRLTTEGTVVGSSSIDNYYLANGTNSFSLGAAAQNVMGGTGADTVAVGALAATGTLALAAGTNNVSLANGGSLAGATTTSASGTWNLILANNASATVRTENLTGGAGVQLTNITAAAAESLTVNTTGAALLGYLLNNAIENWNIGTVGGENNSVNKFSLTQAVTMGAGNDFLNLTNRFGTYSGAIDLGGGTNTIFLAGGAGSRWTGGAGTCKALHPFAKLSGRHRTFLEAHLAKSRRTGKTYGATIPHVFTTSYLTHGPTEDFLRHVQNYQYPGPLHLSPGRSVGLRLVPTERDLRFQWEEMPQQRLDEQQQKVRESLRAALIDWARNTGEGVDYTDNVPLQCLHPVGHFYEVPNLFRNGVLAALLRERPQLKYLLLHNIDTLGANLDPALLGRHIAQGAAFTFEAIHRRLEDRGGGLARVNGRARVVEGLALPREADEFRLSCYNTLSTWMDLDKLLAVFGLIRADILAADTPTPAGAAAADHIAAAIRNVATKLPTYITLKDVKKRWGHGQEDVFPVAQFEKLWGDLSALPEIATQFVVVPRSRGQQLKDQAQLDGWLRDGSAAHVESLCAWQ